MNCDPVKYTEIKRMKIIDPHPIFEVVKGDIEAWKKKT